MRNRIRRALLFVPGDAPKKIEKAAGLEVDAVILDLEDSVLPQNKAAARAHVAHALRTLDFGKTERLVRLHSDADLDVASLADGIVVPKVETAAKLERIPGNTALLAQIETALGIVNLREIAQATTRLSALVLGAEDFRLDAGMSYRADGAELAYARGVLVVHAAAVGLQAIDTIFTRFDDTTGLEAETHLVRDMGFDGKLVIHPGQIDPVQAVFTPTNAEIQDAMALLRARPDAGVFVHNGKMVDAPVLLAAERVIERARAAGIDIEGQ